MGSGLGPLCVFSCCPTAPLKWSYETSQNVIDCARAGIPVEFVSMPLAGFVAPVTLVGSVVQHAAETLSGVVLSQLASAGAPVVWGGSPAIFDIRYETTPMGAIETMMLDCANAEVGQRLGLPTQGYIALSDAKALDAQAGLETGMGAVLASLSGINSVSGPGMLDFESCQSLEKLVLDDEICGMVARLRRGIEPRDDFPSRPLFEELLKDQHLLIAAHTRKHRKEQIRFTSPVVERAPLGRWREEGETTLGQRASREVERLVGAWAPSRLPDEHEARPAGENGPRGACGGHGGAADGGGVREIVRFAKTGGGARGPRGPRRPEPARGGRARPAPAPPSRRRDGTRAPSSSSRGRSCEELPAERFAAVLAPLGLPGGRPRGRPGLPARRGPRPLRGDTRRGACPRASGASSTRTRSPRAGCSTRWPRRAPTSSPTAWPSATGRALVERGLGHARVLPYSPGYCGWPTRGQRPLFDALRPEEIGVTLNDSCLMSPIKTVSGCWWPAPARRTSSGRTSRSATTAGPTSAGGAWPRS